MKILLVEDEATYRETLVFKLERDGYEVLAAASGTAALAVFDGSIDLVLLDLMLPGISGMDVCRQIRTKSTVPIIMLTARDDEIDKVLGLELGADDYVTKPYSYRELVARINAVTRRANETAVVNDEQLDVGPLSMFVDRHEVTVNGELVQMPLREFELLEFFMRNPDRVLTRGQILDRVWGPNFFGDSKTLDVHVKRLRAKLEPDPASPQYIQTIRGLGYKLVPQK